MTDPTPEPTPTPAPAQQGFERLLERHNGDSSAVGVLLFNENYQHRQRIRDLEARLPKEGTVLLSAEDAPRWAALKDVDPAELERLRKEHGEMQQRLADTTRRETLSKAAKLAGFDADVLADLPNLPPVKVTGEGDAQKALVETAQGEVDLAEYVTKQYAKFLPALQPQSTEPPRPQGVMVPRQPVGPAKQISAVQAHISKTKYALPGKSE